MALVIVLLTATLVASIAVGLSLVVSIDVLAARNYRESATLRHIAEAAVDLAAADLSGAGSWDDVLSGAWQSPRSDGLPEGPRNEAGIVRLDLSGESNRLLCGQTSPCSSAQLVAATAERPWGANNPRWVPFLYGSWSTLAPVRSADPAYVVVWVADDPRETDNDPMSDAAPGLPGSGIVRARAEAFGRAGGRRAIEVELARVCPAVGGTTRCLPGIRVQSWREVRRSVP